MEELPKVSTAEVTVEACPEAEVVNCPNWLLLSMSEEAEVVIADVVVLGEDDDVLAILLKLFWKTW